MAKAATKTSLKAVESADSIVQALADIFGAEENAKENFSKAKEELDNRRAGSLRAAAEKLRGLNVDITREEAAEKAEAAAKLISSNPQVIKARKSELLLLIERRFDLMAAVDAVDDLKKQIEESTLEHKPKINTRTEVLRVLRQVRTAEEKVKKGTPGVTIVTVKQAVEARGDELLKEPEEIDVLAQALIKIEEVERLSVFAVEVAGAMMPSAEVSKLCSRLRVLAAAGQSADADDELPVEEAAPQAPALDVSALLDELEGAVSLAVPEVDQQVGALAAAPAPEPTGVVVDVDEFTLGGLLMEDDQ